MSNEHLLSIQIRSLDNQCVGVVVLLILGAIFNGLAYMVDTLNMYVVRTRVDLGICLVSRTELGTNRVCRFQT